MPLDTTIDAALSPGTVVGTQTPASATCGWRQIIDAGRIATIDALPITNPTTQITQITQRIITRFGKGTVLLLRMGYSSAATVSAPPTVKVFGKTGNQAWQLLKTRAGALNAQLTIDATNDARDGTLNYTTSDYTTQAWDCLGCDEFIVGVEVALAVSAGSTATAILQAKVI